jgi:hypothetical protein
MTSILEMLRLNMGRIVRNRIGGWTRRYYQFFLQKKKIEMYAGKGAVR